MKKNVEIDITAVCGLEWKTRFEHFLKALSNVNPATSKKYLSVIDGLLADDFVFSLDRAIGLIKIKNRTYVRAALVKFIDFLEHDGILDESAAAIWRDKKLPRVIEPPPRPRTIPSLEDILLVIDAMEGKDKMILRFMFYTGCRVHEAVNVKMQDIDFNSGRVTIYGKGRLRKKPRLGKLPMEYAAELQKYAKKLKLENGYIFWSASKASASSRCTMLQDKLRKISLEVTGRRIGTHDIRRFCGSYIYQETKDIQLVQKLLGHAKSDTTQRYTQYATQEKQLDQARDIMGSLEKKKENES